MAGPHGSHVGSLALMLSRWLSCWLAGMARTLAPMACTLARMARTLARTLACWLAVCQVSSGIVLIRVVSASAKM